MKKKENNLSTWLDRIEDLSCKILNSVQKELIPDQTDLENRQKLIDIARKNCTLLPTSDQINRINAILEQDREIIMQLEELSVKIRIDIGKAFSNRKAISKFKLNEL